MGTITCISREVQDYIQQPTQECVNRCALVSRTEVDVLKYKYTACTCTLDHDLLGQTEDQMKWRGGSEGWSGRQMEQQRMDLVCVKQTTSPANPLAVHYHCLEKDMIHTLTKFVLRWSRKENFIVSH